MSQLAGKEELDKLLCAALLAIKAGPAKAESAMRKYQSAIDAVLAENFNMGEALTRQNEKTAKLEKRLAGAEKALREIYEVYAGSDGFIPETAPEGYQQRLIKQMADIASDALAQTAKETT